MSMIYKCCKTLLVEVLKNTFNIFPAFSAEEEKEFLDFCIESEFWEGFLTALNHSEEETR